MNEYRPISELPSVISFGDRRMFVVIAINVLGYGSGSYTSDPVTTWRDADGDFPRWKHKFMPTHFCELPDPKNAINA